MAGELSAHTKPPAAIRDIYKIFQKLDMNQLKAHPDLVDAHGYVAINGDSLVATGEVKLPTELRQVFLEFLDHQNEDHPEESNPLEPLAIPSVPGKQLLFFASLTIF